MNTQESIINSHSRVPRRRAKRLVVAGSVTGIVLMGLAAAGLLGRAPASADTVSSSREMDLAIQDTIRALLANESAPRYIDKLDQVVGAGLAILHPDLVIAERRKDPAYVEEEAQATYLIMNPAAVAAELMKDPEFRRECEEASRAFSQGLAP